VYAIAAISKDMKASAAKARAVPPSQKRNCFRRESGLNLAWCSALNWLVLMDEQFDCARQYVRGVRDGALMQVKPG